MLLLIIFEFSNHNYTVGKYFNVLIIQINKKVLFRDLRRTPKYIFRLIVNVFTPFTKLSIAILVMRPKMELFL